MNNKKSVYILTEYAFYDGAYVVMVSKSLVKIKDYYQKYIKGLKRGYGVELRKYVYDKKYDVLNDGELIEHFEKDYLKYDCDMCKFYASSITSGKFFEECKNGHKIDNNENCKDFELDTGDVE